MDVWLKRRSEADYLSSSDALAYSVDRGRLVQSQAFRRLQGKTQVVGTREHDFFRNRLTHSLEVGQIGLRLLLRQQQETQRQNLTHFHQVLPHRDLLETACLAHDIGHPAFGHNGEVVLHQFMKHAGGFEGNGQTIRLVSKLGEFSRGYGYDFTRRTLLALMKYPILFRDAWLDESSEKPPKCLHNTEEDVLMFAIELVSGHDQERFLTYQLKEGKARCNRSVYKSLDCSFMELADDISYAIHDLEDVLEMGLTSKEKASSELQEQLNQLTEIGMEVGVIKKEHDGLFSWLSKAKDTNGIKSWVSMSTEIFIRSTGLVEQGDFHDPLLDLNLQMQDDAKNILQSIKDFVYKGVISESRLQTLEYKGRHIMKSLLDALYESPDLLLPERLSNSIDKQNEASLRRGICDYVSSMTDIEACTLYERLFVPNAGSIFDAV